MFAEGGEDPAILETPAGPLRVVGSYRHLGCRVDCTRKQNAELAAMRSTAQATTVALGHTVLGDRAIPTKVGTCVARSTIHSRLLHQAGTWTCLSQAQLHHLHARYMAPLEAHLGSAQAARAWNSQNVRRRDTADALGAATGSPIGG